MANSRRDFLKKAGILTGMVGMGPLIGSALPPLEQKIYDRLQDYSIWPDEDDIWNWVRSQYTTSPSIINLNNGGVSPQPKVVQDALFRLTESANEAPSYMLWRILDHSRGNVKKKLAGMLQCSEDELAINRNATEALDTIIRGIPLKKGDEVVLSRYDYPRMMNAWKHREKKEGIVLKWVDFRFPENDTATLIQKYTSLFTPKTKVVHLTHLINWVGQVLPVKEIAAEARKQGIKVLVDAAHSFAHLEFTIADLNCDYMGTSLHKWLCAPFGTGLLYVRKEEIPGLESIFVGEPSTETNISKFEELGTRNSPGELAVAHAVDFHLAIGGKRKQERLYFLKKYWTDKVKTHPKIKILTPESPALSGALAFVSIEGKEGADIEGTLFAEHKIHTVGIKHEQLNGIRVTPHVYTHTDELDWLAAALLKIADQG